MEMYLKGADINNVYQGVADKHGVSLEQVKEIVESFWSRCVKDMKEGSQDVYRITKVGKFIKVKQNGR